ncbi:MAG: hypothetical protein ABW220_11015 [Burkholderiaceae bacterium]
MSQLKGSGRAHSKEPSEEPAWRTPATHEFTVRDFRFHTGEILPALRLSYTVLGRPDGKPVLALHGTGASGKSLLAKEFGGQLFAAGGLLDAAEHFLGCARRSPATTTRTWSKDSITSCVMRWAFAICA